MQPKKNIITFAILFLMTLGVMQCVSPKKSNTTKKNVTKLKHDMLIPLENFFKNPIAAQFKLSPDGKRIAFLAPYKSRMNVFVKNLSELNQDPKRLTSVTDRDIAGFFWKGNQTIVFGRDFGGDENTHLFSVDIALSTEKDITPFEGVKAQMIDILIDDENHVIVGLNKRNRQFFDPYLLNVKTGEMDLIMENPGNITTWLTDHKGKLRVGVVTDGVNQVLLYRENEKDSLSLLMQTSFKDIFEPVMFSFDNKDLFVVSNLNRDKTGIIKFNPITKKQEIVYENPDVDVSTLNYSRKRKVLTFVSFQKEKEEKAFLDATTQKLFQELQQRFKSSYEIQIPSMSKDENKLIVYVSNDKTLGYYYYYDLLTKELVKLAELTPWLKEEEMASMTPISYRSSDSLSIHGYLTLPRGLDMSTAKNLPLIVNPHGGPWVRDVWGYKSEVQFLANRGYAILQVNYRGSTGYGKEFWMKAFKQWGLKMQDDITDGVKWLIEKGIVDKERIAICGASYGGYAALVGITKTPDLYACAVDYVGVSSLFTFMQSFPPYWKPYLEMVYEMVGHPEKDKSQFEKTSPVFNVEKITVPLLIAQGAKDPRVKKSESDQMVLALKKRGIDVEYIVKDNEGHGFRNQENRFEFYRAVEAFLSKHLSN